MKFATKAIWCYPPHPRHVAVLPWEIKNSNFLQIFSRYARKCIFVASNFVIHPHVLIISVFKIAYTFPQRNNFDTVSRLGMLNEYRLTD